MKRHITDGVTFECKLSDINGLTFAGLEDGIITINIDCDAVQPQDVIGALGLACDYNGRLCSYGSILKQRHIRFEINARSCVCKLKCSLVNKENIEIAYVDYYFRLDKDDKKVVSDMVAEVGRQYMQFAASLIKEEE